MIAKTTVALALGLGLLVAPRMARADEPSPAEAERSTDKRWYGVQTLVADAGAGALIALAVVNNDATVQPLLGGAGFVTYMVGAPIVHVAHGHVLRGVGDLGFRMITPVATAMVGALASQDSSDEDRDVSIGIGLFAGMAAASAFDALGLAWDDAPKRTADRPTILPGISPTKNGLSAGVTGTF